MLEDSTVVFKKRSLPRENPSSNVGLTLLLQGRGLSHKPSGNEEGLIRMFWRRGLSHKQQCSQRMVLVYLVTHN